MDIPLYVVRVPMLSVISKISMPFMKGCVVLILLLAFNEKVNW
ncbi:hypothetical protein HNQ91_001975 [Filimonas zeae]|nr:hypothetical protein [Filimonas zeae]